MVDNTQVAQQAARRLIIIVGVGVALVALWEIRNILLLLLTSVVLVVFTTTPIRFLTRRGIRRSLAVVTSLLILPLFFLILALTILPLLATQFATLSNLVEAGILRLQESWEALDAIPPQYFLGWRYEILGLQIPRDPFLETAAVFINSFQVDAQLITQVANQIFSAFGQFGVTVIPVVGVLRRFSLMLSS